MNMGRGFNKETLGLNIPQQWAWDAALKTVKVKVVLQVLSAIIQLVCKLWSRMMWQEKGSWFTSAILTVNVCYVALFYHWS